jgi:hypothetical protein
MNDAIQAIGQKTARAIKKGIVWLVILVVLGCGIWVFAALNFVYSKGERAGYVQKLSKKGWIFKTWEGELAMVNLPGTVPELFHFTVRDDAAVRQIQDYLGQRVILTYEEHKGLPGTIFGETSYFVTSSKVVETPSVPKAP